MLKGKGEIFKNWVCSFLYYKLESTYKKSNTFELWVMVQNQKNVWFHLDWVKYNIEKINNLLIKYIITLIVWKFRIFYNFESVIVFLVVRLPASDSKKYSEHDIDVVIIESGFYVQYVMSASA
jgi:hypothetical protein